MSAFPSLPLFTDAFLADTGHLTAQETGAYVLLLMMAWRSPECRLPDDDMKLARWARLDAKTWYRLKPAVMEFWRLEGGYWTQKRLTKEFGVVTKRAERAKQNGGKGGRPRKPDDETQEKPSGFSVGLQDETQTKAPNPNPNTYVKASAFTPVDGAQARSPPKRGHPLPDEFEPNEADRVVAKKEGFSDERLNRELDKIRDWAGATNASRHDWHKTFRNWLREAADRERRARPTQAGRNGSAGGSRLEAYHRAVTRAENSHDVPDGWPDLPGGGTGGMGLSRRAS